MNEKTLGPGTTLDGELPAIYDDPEYPELLRELARLIETGLVQAEVDRKRAAALAESVVEHAREHFGGIPQYWPKGETWRVRQRRQKMWERFDGRNYGVIAKEFGISLSQAYRAIAVARAEWKASNMGSLFPETEKPAGKGGAPIKQDSDLSKGDRIRGAIWNASKGGGES